MEAPGSQSLKLKSGYDMPVVGLGTWELTGPACEKTVIKALELGYTHIDTAELYGNEREIGAALSGAERTRLFLTSKVASSHLAKDDVINSCRQSLKRLKTDYLDLYLVHWPSKSVPLTETLEGMQELAEDGLVRSIGVSNFSEEQLREAIRVSELPICNIQVEYHPYTCRDSLLALARRQAMALTAYSPLARGKVVSDPVLGEIGVKYGKTAAQVSLKWLLQKGCIVIPKASSEEHLRSNMEVFGWLLSPGEMEEIDDIKTEMRLVDK